MDCDSSDPNFGRRIWDYITLATRISDAAHKAGTFAIAKRKIDCGEGWSGQVGTISSLRAWICFDARLWANHGLSPIWLEFEENDRVDRRLKDLFELLKDRFNCVVDSPQMDPMYSIPLPIRAGVAGLEAVSEAVARIQQVATVLRPRSE
jgi:hypothetical protein